MTDELKPCPFCGGEARVHIDRRSNVLNIGCKDCGIGTIYVVADEVGLKEAVGAWNTRAERTTELIVAADDLGKDLYPCMCFQCGYTKLDDFWRKNHVNYCPNCGAKVVDK